jgi:serine/threonine protein kinase/Flp pilus assembly protein TadD/TolA-binding protein
MSKICPKCHADNPKTSSFCAGCGTQLLSLEDIDITETLETPKEELTTGSTFAGRYQIIEELGKGGMGKVYKALDTEVNEKIALKLIKPEIAADKKTIDRFRNELKFARKIRHKNVCQMYDLGTAEGAYFITMEYVSGEDLKRLIRKMGNLSPSQAISIAKQVCDGMVEAHKLGVVHRDLKPQNVMVDERGDARIMDFGVARSIEGKSITGAGVMIGTPDYMSPEQVDGKDIDQRTDIYSLGVILYEMVTGQTPFEGDTPFTIGIKHKSETPKNPKELNALIPDDLCRVILRCLEKDRGERYQSAGEVRSDLINIEKGIPTTERFVPERKPLTSREITVQVSMKKLIIPAVIVLALAVIAVLIWQLIPQKGAISPSTDKPSLAIMYFENNTGDRNLDHWRKALSELLTADLSQSKYLSVMSGDRLYNILDDLSLLDSQSYSSEDLERVGTRGGVENIVRGSYTKAGDNFRINIMLQKVNTGELIGSERVEGTGEEGMFTMVDELTKRIKENFELSTEEISSDLDKEVGKITTSSPEAYKYYSEGRRYHTIGENRKSIELMERAIVIDPQFAMAYRSIAVSYNNLFLFAERKKYMEKALEFVDRLSERERYIIEGDYYWSSEATYDKAIAAYTKLLELYPDDMIVNHNLAVSFQLLEDYEKAIEKYEICTRAGEEFIHSHTQLADAYAAKGLYDEAKEILRNYIDNISDHVLAHHGLAYLHLDLGEFDQALAETEKAIYLDPTNYENLAIKGDIYLYGGEFEKAEEEYLKLMQTSEPAGQGKGFICMVNLKVLQGKFEEAMSLVKRAVELSQKLGQKEWESHWHFGGANFYMRTGNMEEAIKECDEAWKSAEEIGYLLGQRRALYFKALALLKTGAVDEAQKTANDLKVMIDQGLRKRAIRFYFHLAGMLELEAGNFSRAVQYFNDALSLVPYGPLAKRADFVDSLAQAYYKSGDLEKALEEYDRITTLTTGRDRYGDIHAKSFYMLGKIYEEQGDTAKAIEHYERFLTLWKDADPGIAEIEDAKKRLVGLRTQ